jgi:diguanylate cyclase (GGDEF)-like protein
MSQANEALDQLLDEAMHHQRRNLGESRRLAQEALALSEALGNIAGQVYALRIIAATDLQQGSFNEGEVLLEQALALARPLGEAAPLSACLHTRAWLHHARGELMEAVSLYREAIALRLGPGDEIALANTYNLLGITFRELGDFEQALTLYAQARDLHRRHNNPSGEGNCLNNLGTLEGDRGCYPEALRYYQEALECSRSCGDQLQESSALYNITHQNVLMGNLKEAVLTARKMRTCAQLLDNPNQLTMARFLDGMVFSARGLFARAERSFLVALAQSRELQDNHLETRILNDLGNLYLRWRRPHEAKNYLEQCRELAESMQANLQLLTCHEYMVEVMEQLQDFERALYHHREFYHLERQRFDSATEKQRLVLRMSLDIERREREMAHQQERNKELEELTRRDSMTGLYNHGAFQEFLRERLAREQPLALLFLDVDHFKDYNDAFGHPAGDAVLQSLARVLCESLHEGDIAARYGGEEFAVILTGASAKRAHACATQLGQRIRETPFPHRRVTLSVGVALATPGITPDRLIATADTALYQAKNAGRDRWARAA